MRYAKRGRLRFASHRDISRAVERAVRRAGVPVAFSAGFSPHPKISYSGAAAPTGVASEAEYLEIGVTERCDPSRLRHDLDASLPVGLDVLDVVEAGSGGLAERLEASDWEVRLNEVAPDEADEAVRAFLTTDRIEVERLTKKGIRRFDTRSAVVSLRLEQRVGPQPAATCAILRMVVRHVTPAVRPDDVLVGLRLVAGLAPPSPPEVTRLAQGPLGQATGGLADPLAPDREAQEAPPEGEQWTVDGAGTGATPQGPMMAANVVVNL